MPHPSVSASAAAFAQQQEQHAQQRQPSQQSAQKMLSNSAPRPMQPSAQQQAARNNKNNNDGNNGTAAATWKAMTPKRDRDNDEGTRSAQKTKKAKRKGGKACVYCRRSHMVCEGGRPCERCIKRDIAHLCRDVSPPPSAKKGGDAAGSSAAPSADPEHEQVEVKAESLPQPPGHPTLVPQQGSHQQLFDAGSSSWPLLTDPNAGPSTGTIDLSTISTPTTNGVSSSGWGGNAEFGFLSDMLKTLRVPTLPGGFVDVLSQVVRNNNGNNSNNTPTNPPAPAPATNPQPPPQMDIPLDVANGAGNGSAQPSAPPDPKGKGKAEPFSAVSRIEQYLLAAADQPDGSRASRLTQVIRAKYEAGLLKPYDYIKGYERMNRWMDSGRAARVEGSSRPNSPTKGGSSTKSQQQRLVVPPPPSGSSISPESRRRILAALEGFRPRFRRIAKELTDLDLVFVEEANERLMLQYDRALASIHTPSCIWRRTGEIQKANQEFAKLTGIPAPLFRNGQLCVYELMDEDSAVRFWEGYGKVAFEKGQSHMYTHCTLKIPLSLTRAHPSRTQSNTPAHPPTVATSSVPDFHLPQSIAMTPMTSAQGASSTGFPTSSTPGPEEEYRVIKTCFSITIRRDRYGIPVAIMGQWIPIGQ